MLTVDKLPFPDYGLRTVRFNLLTPPCCLHRWAVMISVLFEFDWGARCAYQTGFHQWSCHTPLQEEQRNMKQIASYIHHALMQN